MIKVVDPDYDFIIVSKELKLEYESFKTTVLKYKNFTDWACQFKEPVDTK